MALYKTLRKLTRLVPGSEQHWTAGVRTFPQKVVLDVAPGVTPSNKPPVRMFMGTEPRQHRAERVWIWSVLQVRDPSRVYEIYLMKDIAGFDRRLWLTGFTNYRFSIPHWAGKTGRAIYNDVDQIYLTDPAELFDTPMGEHGFLALSPKDTSVMLIDCEKMAAEWSLEDAKHGRRKPIEAKARHCWGPLDPMWNSRDEEYVAGRSKVLHYTTIHAQPWQPFPERYVYLANKVGYVWHDLERSADKAGFQVFTQRCPSDEFEFLMQRAPSKPPEPRDVPEGLAEVIADAEVKAIADIALSPDRGAIVNAAPHQTVVGLGLLAPALEGKSFDAVVCADELDFVPVADIPWVVERLFDHASHLVYASVSARPRSRLSSDGTPLSNHAADESWWSWHFARAGARHPHVRWRLAVRTQQRGREVMRVREGGRHADKPPLIWVLADDKAGHGTQSLGLAQALGWPCIVKKLEFNALNRLSNQLIGASLLGVERGGSDALEAPWPDLVISTGRRTAPVARWIGEQSRGHARLVQLGRKGGEIVDGFDLVVTCAHFRLPIHPRRIETVLPLNGVTPTALADAAREWQSLFDGAPAPHVALIVGGDSAMHRLDAATAQRMGEEVRAFAEKAGGTVSAITSPRTSPEAVRALEQALSGRHRVDPWRKGAAKNPYLAHLAKADVLVVTGESESMLSEAVQTGKPVYIYPLPQKPTSLRARLSNWAVARANSRPRKAKGTVRPQQGIEYVCARLIQRGVIRPRRDLNLLHELLVGRGLAHRWGTSLVAERRPAVNEVEVVAQRVREIVGYAADAPEPERFRMAG
jgi:mitochondrial fission protein ELM1